MSLFKNVNILINKVLVKLFYSRNLILTKGVKIHPTAAVRSAVLAGDVEINEGCKIIDGVSIQVGSSFKIGAYSSVNGPTTNFFAKLNPVIIGSFCSIARNVTFQEYYHKYKKITSYNIGKNIFGADMDYDIYSKGPIIIENDVWIGTHSVILSGVTISNGAIIAANSVVNSNIPPYAIAAGNPAKIVGYRFDQQMIDRLLALKWWDWPISKIKKNQKLFDNDLSMQHLDHIL